MKLDDLIDKLDDNIFVNIFMDLHTTNLCIYSGYVENCNVKPLLYVYRIFSNDDTLTIEVKDYD